MRELAKRLVWPSFALALLLAFNVAFTHDFLAIHVKDTGRLYGIVIDILVNGSRVMLLALAMTLVIATGGVDLSVGAVMALAGATAAVLVNQHHSIGSAALTAAGVAACAGTVNGLLVARVGLQPIVATLVLMVAGRGIAQLLADVPIVTFTDPGLCWFAAGHFIGMPVSVWIVAAVGLLMWALTRRTALGLMIEALGDNQNAAREVGIPVTTIKTCVYVISGLCASIAGLIDAATVTAADTYNSGLNLELDAVLAVVIGGTALVGGRFSLSGSIIGALLIQTLTTTLLLRDFNPNVLTLPKSILVIAVCVLQSPKVRHWIQHARQRLAPRGMA